MKIGRNVVCPCGSKRKYKKCCGNPCKVQTASVQKLNSNSFPPELLAAIERKKAEELTRQQQQGLGRPIIAANFNGQQFVVAGKEIRSSSKWKTFPDFLSDYLKDVLGREWGNAELVKPLVDRHSILQWYDVYCNHQKKFLSEKEEIKNVPTIGAMFCYIGLAYSLYLLKHNAELQEILINRLKNFGNFQGAYYETIIINGLIRAGFYDIAFENEADLNSKHCEFSATSKRTGKRYTIEVRMKGVAGLLGRTHKDGSANKNPTSSLSDHLKDALKKPATGERLIFIDLNAEPHLGVEEPLWVKNAVKTLQGREKVLQGEKAYAFITNIPFHRTLENQQAGGITILSYGLGIPDFCKIGWHRYRDIYLQKQKHIDAHEIIQALGAYTNVPITFDGTLPSEALSEDKRSLKIDEKYFFEDLEGGKVGIIKSATVDKNTKTAYYIIHTEDNQLKLISRVMTDNEFQDYKRHPETFFGKIQKVSKVANTGYEFFENLVEQFKGYTREQLLDMMKKAKDIEDLRKMDQHDLLMEYCERLAGMF